MCGWTARGTMNRFFILYEHFALKCSKTTENVISKIVMGNDYFGICLLDWNQIILLSVRSPARRCPIWTTLYNSRTISTKLILKFSGFGSYQYIPFHLKIMWSKWNNIGVSKWTQYRLFRFVTFLIFYDQFIPCAVSSWDFKYSYHTQWWENHDQKLTILTN